MSVFRDFFVKEKPVFTGITRGVGGFGFGFGGAASSGGGGGGGGSASGGSVSTPGNGYKYHFFTNHSSPEPFQITGGAITLDYLAIAGGGSGGSYNSAYTSGTHG